MLWAQLWNEMKGDADEEREMRVAWRKGLQEVILDKKGWRAAKGPLSATVAVLNQIGWKPIAPGYWQTKSQDREATLSNKNYDNYEIADAVSDAYEEAAWQSASQHYLGGRLEHGPPCLDLAKLA